MKSFLYSKRVLFLRMILDVLADHFIAHVPGAARKVATRPHPLGCGSFGTKGNSIIASSWASGTAQITEFGPPMTRKRLTLNSNRSFQSLYGCWLARAKMFHAPSYLPTLQWIACFPYSSIEIPHRCIESSSREIAQNGCPPGTAGKDPRFGAYSDASQGLAGSVDAFSSPAAFGTSGESSAHRLLSAGADSLLAR